MDFRQSRENTLVGELDIVDDITSQRSPSQAVLSAFGLVFWVILWLPTAGLSFHDDNEIIIIGREDEAKIYRVM